MNKGTKEQKNKGTKEQRNKGTKKQKVHPIGSGITRSPGLVFLHPHDDDKFISNSTKHELNRSSLR